MSQIIKKIVDPKYRTLKQFDLLKENDSSIKVEFTDQKNHQVVIRIPKLLIEKYDNNQIILKDIDTYRDIVNSIH